MLGIVLEFDDVVSAVVAAHQVGLRAAPHPADMLDGKHHGGALTDLPACGMLCARANR